WMQEVVIHIVPRWMDVPATLHTLRHVDSEDTEHFFECEKCQIAEAKARRSEPLVLLGENVVLRIKTAEFLCEREGEIAQDVRRAFFLRAPHRVRQSQQPQD